jgi:hypothetical protein
MKQESTEIIHPTGGFGLLESKPNYMLSFHKEGKQVGTFDFNEGKMHFEGELSESGEIFVDWVIGAFKQRLDDAVKAEREACAKRASVALLGTLQKTSDRVLRAIQKGNDAT